MGVGVRRILWKGKLSWVAVVLGLLGPGPVRIAPCPTRAAVCQEPSDWTIDSRLTSWQKHKLIGQRSLHEEYTCVCVWICSLLNGAFGAVCAFHRLAGTTSHLSGSKNLSEIEK